MPGEGPAHRMSLFDDTMAEIGVAALFEALGDAITYTPKGGAAVSLTGLVGFGEITDHEERGLRKRLIRDVTITRDPTSEFGGVANPSLTATVTIDGAEYAITEIQAESASMATLVLAEKKQLEITRKNYRETW